MKKYISIGILCLALGTNVQAQGKKLQRLAEQIVLLEVYKGYLKTGYKIARNGLNLISGFTNGEFSLYKVFFGSLKTVNPNVRKYAKVAGIIAMQLKIVKAQNRLRKGVTEAGVFGEEELEHIRNVLQRLMEACGQSLDELITLTTNGELEMRDDERLQRIDELYEDMLVHYKFSQAYSLETMEMAGFRKREQAELGFERIWHGINQEK